MIAQDLVLSSLPPRKASRFSVSGLQKGLEIATAILMVATFTVWFFLLSA